MLVIRNTMSLQRMGQMNLMNVNLLKEVSLSVRLRCGFGQKPLAWIFGLGKSTISRYLITWSNYLYF